MSGVRLPSLTVLVLNFRNAAATLRCLESLEVTSYNGPMDVVVLENGSGDDSWLTLSAFAGRTRLSLCLLQSQVNHGFAGGVNHLWPEARGEYVCLLNNDAEVHRDCLARLVETLVIRPDLGAVWPYDGPPEWAAEQRVLVFEDLANLRNGTHSLLGGNIWLPLLRDYRECFTASGVCLVVRRTEHQQPFLNEYFAYHEDVYLGWRLRIRGLACERVPEAVIYHAGSQTSARDPSIRGTLARHAEKNRLVNICLFYQASTLASLVPLIILDEAKKLLVAAIRMVTGRGGVAYLAVLLGSRWWVLAHWRWIVAQRRRIQQERLMPDSCITPLMSGRLTMDLGFAGALLNRVSLRYCRLVGLRTCEGRPA
jgi:GT2 family glycosyltransferase